MISSKNIFTLTLFSGAGIACAVPITEELTLTLRDDAETIIGMSVSTTDGAADRDTDTVSYSGEFAIDLTLDTFGLRPLEIVFTDGRVSFSESFLDVSALIHYDAVNDSITTFIQQRTEGISSITRTLDTGFLGAMGEVRNEDHESTFDRGTVEFTVTILGSPQSNLLDYGVEPSVGDISGETTLLLSELSRDLFQREVKVELQNKVDFTEDVPFPDTNATFTFTEVGEIVAEGTLVLPTDYGQWLSDEELGNELPETLNASGLPYSLLYALQLPVGSERIPVAAVSVEGEPEVVIQLPVDGLRARLIPQFSPDLTSDSWSDLEGLEVGESGEQVVSFPDGERGFIRFYAESPQSE